jgi:uncharacterized protein YlzI (FlbEa/FlbD family)
MGGNKFTAHNTVRTICEKIREVYWTVDDPKVRSVLEEINHDAKAMNRKLRTYKADYAKEMMWEETMTDEEARAKGEERLARLEAELDTAENEVNERIKKYDRKMAKEEDVERL